VAAARAKVNSSFFFIEVGARKGRLCVFPAHDVIALTAQTLPPFGISQLEFGAKEAKGKKNEEQNHIFEVYRYTRNHSKFDFGYRRMEALIESSVKPETVWKAWESAHAIHANGPIVPGKRSKSTGFKYKILDVVDGVRFSILWKSLFVRMVFTHSVKPAKKGSEIRYSAEIQGFFAWPVRFMLKNKIRKNLTFVLKQFTAQLERQIKA
jgi:hypothetical protein